MNKPDLKSVPDTELPKYSIGAVPAHMIDVVWSQVEPLVQRVEEKAPDDIVSAVLRQQLKRGEKMLVVVSKQTDIIAINVLDVITLNSGVRVLYIPVTAGEDLEEWMESFLKIAKAIAKDYNCTELRGLAVRKGWMRVLKDHGWEELFTTIRCELGE